MYVFEIPEPSCSSSRLVSTFARLCLRATRFWLSFFVYGHPCFCCVQICEAFVYALIFHSSTLSAVVRGRSIEREHP